MKLLESRQKAAQRGRRGGVAAIQFRDIAKQRNRIHKMGTRRGGDRMGNQKNGRRGGIVRRRSSAAFWATANNNKYEQLKLKCMGYREELRKYCQKVYLFFTVKVELKKHELCYEFSATDRFSFVLMVIQIIILSTGLILKLLDTAGVTNSTELTEPTSAFNCDKNIYNTCTEPIVAWCMGWIVIIVMLVPFGLAMKMLRKAYADMKKEKESKKKAERKGQGLTEMF